MTNFISHVLDDLETKQIPIEQIRFILPSKRAGIFLKNQLANRLSQPTFSPEILSVEAFVEELSGLRLIDSTQAIFELYNSYIEETPKAERESFDQFYDWAQILLQDFNEIDRYLIPPEDILNYLGQIKSLEHWSLDPNPTQLIKNYLKFWERLDTYYLNFTSRLIKKKQGYQGLIYREATGNLEHYMQYQNKKTHVFLGFNALNSSESHIIQGLLQNDQAYIYWDIDEHFIKDHIHAAGLFINDYKSQWNYYRKHPFNWTFNNYSQAKDITAIGAPKIVGQAKYVGGLLQTLASEENNLSHTAVVLGDETLLMPLLNSLPDNLGPLNITMGLPLHAVPMSSLFHQLFELHKTPSSSYYYKQVNSLLSHPVIYLSLNQDGQKLLQNILGELKKNNRSYITYDDIYSKVSEEYKLITLLFKPWEDSAENALNNIVKIIFLIKDALDADKTKNALELEFLHRFYTLFNQLQTLHEENNHLKSVKLLQRLFNELLSSENVDLRGEPLQGLQIMGMLETRVLDFETIIITGVNEGILPAGKSQNSFIPFDVKVQYQLPTFKEKDAVYTYHFYRLLQRAKKVYLVYNTEVDTLQGGEKSRFITQLKAENIHTVNETIVAPQIPLFTTELRTIKKTSAVLEQLKRLAVKGFSPSSLTNYIRNPLDFYQEKILGIKPLEEVEENVAYNTLGSILHKVLEELYDPYVGTLLTETAISNMTQQSDMKVEEQFKAFYHDGDISTGKNLIIFEVAKKFIHRILNKELAEIRAGRKIEILALEKELSYDITINGLNFPVTLKGIVDRIDLYDGTLRIIDYKTGKVAPNEIEIIEWDLLTSDYKKYSKSFQLLTYAFMYSKTHNFSEELQAGIISFKRLQDKFVMLFSKKDRAGKGAQKVSKISSETLENYQDQLEQLLLELFNPEIDFKEKNLE